MCVVRDNETPTRMSQLERCTCNTDFSDRLCTSSPRSRDSTDVIADVIAVVDVNHSVTDDQCWRCYSSLLGLLSSQKAVTSQWNELDVELLQRKQSSSINYHNLTTCPFITVLHVVFMHFPSLSPRMTFDKQVANIIIAFLWRVSGCHAPEFRLAPKLLAPLKCTGHLMHNLNLRFPCNLATTCKVPVV